MPSVNPVVIAVLFAATLPPAVRAQQLRPPVDSATAATIHELLALTGSVKLALSGMEAMLPAQRAANPRIPPVFWDAFLARARADTSRLSALLVPIYAAHFTRPELEQLVRFYRTPLGARLLKELPPIMQESVQAGQSWGAQIGSAVAESLTAAGVRFPGPQ